ncbi:hypothetical protein, partial [Roseomonas sp. 18066]|uniref:hypothetical protein n=1 Tax=Roseomonas sp. 18066 TaxID=2681412 RepID=UPI00190F26F5
LDAITKPPADPPRAPIPAAAAGTAPGPRRGAALAARWAGLLRQLRALAGPRAVVAMALLLLAGVLVAAYGILAERRESRA